MSVRAAATLEALKPKTDLTLIPGGKGKAVHMKKGDTIKIINTGGSQVILLSTLSIFYCFALPSSRCIREACMRWFAELSGSLCWMRAE